jgi:hypothetical protein
MKERDHLEYLDVDGKITFNCILHNRMRNGGLDSSGSGHGQVMGCCKDCNEYSGSVNEKSFLLLKEDSALWS